MIDLHNLKKEAVDEIDRLEERLWDLSLKIHRNPELSFEEVKAANWITAELEALGFQVEREVAGLPTAFKASFEGKPGGPTVALQAEYDALPEIGHACGHNIIATTAVGGAAGVKAVLEELPGRIVVMGTPAEEGGGGKITMLEQGAYDDIDVALYIHAQSRNAVMGGNMAMGSMTVRFHGVPASPGGGKPPEGQEHLGANALAALLSTFNNIDAIRQHIQRDVILRGIITQGGIRHEYVTLLAEGWFSVRGPNHLYLKEVLSKIENCARAAALSTGAQVEIVPELLYAERFMNRPLMDAIRNNMLQLGLPDVQEDGIAASSTDSGNVNQVIPLSGAFVAIVEPGITPHSPPFATAAGSKKGRLAMLTGAKILAWSALDIITQPHLYEAIQKDFRLRTGREPGRER